MITHLTHTTQGESKGFCWLDTYCKNKTLAGIENRLALIRMILSSNNLPPTQCNQYHHTVVIDNYVEVMATEKVASLSPAFFIMNPLIWWRLTTELTIKHNQQWRLVDLVLEHELIGADQ